MTQPPPPPHPEGSGPDASRAAKKPWWKRWWGIALIAFIGIGILSSLGEDPDGTPVAGETTSTADEQPAATEAETPADEPTATSAPETVAPEPEPEPEPEPGFGDGTHAVGSDIEPGTYRSTGTSTCYWVRMRDFSGDFEAIIANGNNTPEIVSIAADDAGFETRGCGRWVPVEGTYPPAPASEFEHGTFAVGHHIEPGTYRSDGEEMCYWARLSGFTHDGINDVITNGNNSTTIEISASDVGFTTFGCGTWTKVG